MAETESPRRWRLSQTYQRQVVTVDPRRLAGRVTLTIASHVGRVSYLCLEILRGLGEWRVWLPRTVEQAQSIGYGSLFIVIITSIFAGAVVSLQAGYQFTGSIPVYYAAGVIVESVILELGPVLTGLLLAGRI